LRVEAHKLGAKVRHPEWPAFWRLLDTLDEKWKQ